mmetsp:Transcript_18807/g.42992  ORF Transcript_18807/g.42992 Transcript_18807/m.42992 type:complete len:393 (-) Transcript_18807:898-2076(-)
MVAVSVRTVPALGRGRQWRLTRLGITEALLLSLVVIDLYYMYLNHYYVLIPRFENNNNGSNEREALQQQQQHLLPGTTEKKGTAALCAIQIEGLRYIDEWVDYNLYVAGFAKIYLYDNSESFELKDWIKTRDDSHRIEVRHFPGRAMQFKAYTLCGRSIRDQELHEWIAFFDIDEFLVIGDGEGKNNHRHVMDVLDTLPADAGGLAVNWHMYYFNNQREYEPKPLSLRFQKRDPLVNQHVKTIARARFFDRSENPHFVYYRNRTTTHTVDSRGTIVEGPFNKDGPSDRIVLNHYRTKSLSEFQERCARGTASGREGNRIECKPVETILKHFPMNDAGVFDDRAWKLLKERVPKYAGFDEWKRTEQRTQQEKKGFDARIGPNFVGGIINVAKV